MSYPIMVQEATRRSPGLSSPGDFKRAARFGIIDNGVLVVSALVGFALDDYIERAVGQRGYGPIVGAGVGNAISDALAGIPEGGDAALGYLMGSLLPLAPLGIAMAGKAQLGKKTKMALSITSAVLVGTAFLAKETT